jgi:hypothetical protein
VAFGRVYGAESARQHARVIVERGFLALLKSHYPRPPVFDSSHLSLGDDPGFFKLGYTP